MLKTSCVARGLLGDPLRCEMKRLLSPFFVLAALGGLFPGKVTALNAKLHRETPAEAGEATEPRLGKHKKSAFNPQKRANIESMLKRR